MPSDRSKKDVYFEDIETGVTYETPSRTITLPELNAFLALTEDDHPIHHDTDYVKRLGFDAPLVPGVFTMSLLTGLEPKLGWNKYVALLGVVEASFRQPIHVGDSIRAAVEVLDKRYTKDRKRGILTIKHTVLNQRDEHVATFVRRSMMEARGT